MSKTKPKVTQFYGLIQSKDFGSIQTVGQN